MVNRSPIEVARSLEMRNGFSIAVGLALWERYNIAALNATRGRRRIQVNHADLMADPVATVRQLHQNLEELDVRGLREPSDEEIRAFIDPSVYRAKERQVCGRLSPAQRKLRRAFQSGRILLLEKAIHFSAESQEVLSQHDRWMEAQDKIAEHEKAFAQTQKELEQARASAAAHRNMLEKSENEKSELKNQISLQAAAIARDQRRIEKLRELLSKAGKLLERVLTSSRWRIGSLVLFRSRRFAGELDPRWRRRLLGEYKTWIQQGGEYSTTDPAKSHSTSISKTDGSGGPVVEKKLNPSLAFRADPSAGRKGGERGGQSISIVIPVYNAYDDLIRCLESVQRHSRPNHPVIVIDDSPDERIWPWLQRWATQHQNFRVVRNNSNLGYTATETVAANWQALGTSSY